MGAIRGAAGRPLLCARLHSMAADGSDLVQLSWHDTSEWQPSVDHSGMIVYTRWDYVDRDPDCTQQMWTCYPDGRNPRSYHGNYPAMRGAGPYMELSIRAIPGSTRYLAVAPPHHGQQYGTLILIDPHKPDDRRMSQVKRVTPEVAFPESETPWYCQRGLRHAVAAQRRLLSVRLQHGRLQATASIWRTVSETRNCSTTIPRSAASTPSP